MSWCSFFCCYALSLCMWAKFLCLLPCSLWVAFLRLLCIIYFSETSVYCPPPSLSGCFIGLGLDLGLTRRLLLGFTPGGAADTSIMADRGLIAVLDFTYYIPVPSAQWRGTLYLNSARRVAGQPPSFFMNGYYRCGGALTDAHADLKLALRLASN